MYLLHLDLLQTSPSECPHADSIVQLTSAMFETGCTTSVQFAEGEDMKTVEFYVSDDTNMVLDSILTLKVSLEATSGSFLPSLLEGQDEIKILTPVQAADGVLQFVGETFLTLSEPAEGSVSATLVIERQRGTYVPGGTGSVLVEAAVVRVGESAAFSLQPAIQFLTFNPDQTRATVVLQLFDDNIAEEQIDSLVRISPTVNYCTDSGTQCLTSSIQVSETNSTATVRIPASDSPYGSIQFVTTSVRNLLGSTDDSTLSLTLERTSGLRGPIGPATVKYTVFESSDEITSGEITFLETVPDNRIQRPQIISFLVEVGMDSKDYSVVLSKPEGSIEGTQ